MAAVATTIGLVGVPVLTASPSSALPADLDPSFGNNGTVIETSQPGRFEALAVQADGKLVAAGEGFPETTGRDFQIVRYLSDGRLDTGFGNGGRVFSDFGQYERIWDLVLQPDGKIVVFGDRVRDGLSTIPISWVVARYNPDGSPDSSFGTAGHVLFPGFGYHGAATSMALQPDGKIVLAGSLGESLAMERLNPDGTVDASFAPYREGPGLTAKVGVQPSGRIVVATRSFATNEGEGGELVVRGLLADGSLDQTFATSGLVNLGEHPHRDMVIQPDGKIVLVGSPDSNGWDPYFEVARLSADGVLDTSFGQGGRVAARVGDAQFAHGLEIAVHLNGSVTVSGWASAPFGTDQPYIPNQFFVAQLTATGSLDPAFGAYGIATFTIGGRIDALSGALAVQADGKPVLAGFFSSTSLPDRAFITRLHSGCACLQPRSVLIAFHSGKVIDLPGGSAARGTAIKQWGWNGGLNQQWRLERVGAGAGSGIYKITSLATGMVLDVTGGSTAEGTAIVQWPWNGGLNQQWAVIPFPANQNVLVLLSMQSGLAIEVGGGSAADGVGLVQRRWRGELNQVWGRVTF